MSAGYMLILDPRTLSVIVFTRRSPSTAFQKNITIKHVSSTGALLFQQSIQTRLLGRRGGKPGWHTPALPSPLHPVLQGNMVKPDRHVSKTTQLPPLSMFHEEVRIHYQSVYHNHSICYRPVKTDLVAVRPRFCSKQL